MQILDIYKNDKGTLTASLIRSKVHSIPQVHRPSSHTSPTVCDVGDVCYISTSQSSAYSIYIHTQSAAHQPPSPLSPNHPHRHDIKRNTIQSRQRKQSKRSERVILRANKSWITKKHWLECNQTTRNKQYKENEKEEESMDGR